MRKEIYQAFCANMDYESSSPAVEKEIDVVFEHDQWWVIDKTATTDDDRWPKNYSVVDEIPGIDGFGFEEV